MIETWVTCALNPMRAQVTHVDISCIAGATPLDA